MTTHDDSLPPLVEGGRITGRVTDFEGYPMVGVLVETATSGGADLDLLPTMTDGEGRFVLEGLGEGSYDLRFELGTVRARALDVPTGTEDLAVKLTRPRGILLVVKTGDGEVPPDLLHVVLDRETERDSVREYEGRHLTARMLLWSIRPGRYTVTVWGGPWLPVTAPGIEVGADEEAPVVEMLLTVQGTRVEGMVVDSAGSGVPEALVAWRRLDAPSPWTREAASTTCDGTGRFLVSGLPPGTYRFSAGPVEGPFADREVEVPARGFFTVALALPDV